MRLAYICADPGIPVLGYKGASVHVRSISSALQSLGHEVTLICALLGEGNEAPGVRRLVRLEAADLGEPRFLTKLFRTLGIEAVVERYSLALSAARAASAGLRIPHVLEVNAPLVLEAARHRGLDDVEPWLARERELFTRTDAAVVVQPSLRDYVRHIAPELPVTHVANGVDLDGFSDPAPADLDLPAGSTVIGFVGSMKPWHGVADLLTAFSFLARHRPRAHLVMVGDGPELAELRRRVSLEGLDQRVHLTGAISHAEVPGMLRAFDIATAPFRPSPDFYFGPLKVYEYLAAGLPVVHPSLGDMPQLIGAAGVAYPAGDIAKLAAALQELLDDPERRSILGNAARRAAAGHSWTSTARAVFNVVGEAVARKSAPPTARSHG
jgi:glycosyltransferase involved in cell wall biosynthesis